MLKSLPSCLVRTYTPSSQSAKAYWRSIEKKIPKRVGARTQPCFTPLLTGKGSEVAPSKQTVLCMSWWKEVMTTRRLGGHPIFWRIWKSPLLLTKSKALVRSTNAMNNGCCCSRHFSCSWQREKIMSTVDLPALKPHCDSG